MLGIMMVILLWITGVLFILPDSAQMNIVSQPNSVITAASGENVTLHCFRTENRLTEAIIWYKQAVGQEPRVIVTVYKSSQNPIFEDKFNSPRFTVDNSERSCHLKITNVQPSDEAMYYCGLEQITISFGKGTFLSVKGDQDVKVSVFQSSVSDTVPAGASVTLQCSVLSESRAAELQVLWFRAAPSQSHPQIIYTHHNSSLQCESSTHTCVYNLSKNILSLNDTGTYYCAVVLCGKIIFGNGTRVHLVESVDPGLICLTVALGVCVIVISVQTLLLCKKTKYGKYKKAKSSVKKPVRANNQDGESVELNYAALHFNEKENRTRREKRKYPQEALYSEVRSFTIA
ncbi:putative immune-type receptor 13 isoform 1 precursor [Silurus asotus]|uniref:Immune-type receptor 13 isoform 1 n=1 Tax=Silurus asotus TaxID=30991 RepID=A0AAD5FQF7_SILAS|nr:putative immune-type receptor 13 isoform 1 precursor [Silurus asotus]